MSNVNYPPESAKVGSGESSGLSPWQKLKQTFRDCRLTFRSGGFKAVFKKYGWRIFAVFFVYYLIRDSIIYILIPYVAAKHIFN